MTNMLVDDSLDFDNDYISTSELDLARNSLIQSLYACLDNPLSKLILVKSKLVRVEKLSNSNNVDSSQSNTNNGQQMSLMPYLSDPVQYFGTFKTYTYFGIPMGSVEVTPEGVNCGEALF